MVILFILFAMLAIAAALAILFRIVAVDKQVDELCERVMHLEKDVSEHTERLDAHIKDIKSNSKHIDSVDKALYEHSSKKSASNIYSKDVRSNAELLIIDNYGKRSLRDLSAELHIPPTTIARWTKQLKSKGLIK